MLPGAVVWLFAFLENAPSRCAACALSTVRLGAALAIRANFCRQYHNVFGATDVTRTANGKTSQRPVFVSIRGKLQVQSMAMLSYSTSRHRRA